MKPAKLKAPMTQYPVCNKETPPPPTTTTLPLPEALQPQRFSPFVAIYTLQDRLKQDDDCFAGNEGDEFDADTSGNDNNSGDSDDEVYI